MAVYTGSTVLSFLAYHEATVRNMCYEKKNIHRQNWQYPKFKQWSCIDFVVMSQKDRKHYSDASGKRGAYHLMFI